MDIDKDRDAEHIVRTCQEMVEGGTDIKGVIEYLHGQQLTITECMKTLIIVYDMSLHDAKSLVSTHPVWNDIVSSSEALQIEAEHVIREEEKKQSD